VVTIFGIILCWIWAEVTWPSSSADAGSWHLPLTLHIFEFWCFGWIVIGAVVLIVLKIIPKR
jgi:hypothetical protein